MAAHDGRIRANRRTLANRRGFEFRLTAHIRTRIDHIGEHARWPAKDIITQHHAFIERNIVLDLAAMADGHFRSDHRVLPDRAILADHRPREDVTEMPDFGTATDHRTIIDIARYMDQDAGKARIFPHFAHRSGSIGEGMNNP